MQIVMKVAKSGAPEAVKLVNGLLREVLSEAELKRATVAPVFPNVTAGRRAGMVVLDLDDATSSLSVKKVLDHLRDSDAVEYARPAAPRTPARTPGRGRP